MKDKNNNSSSMLRHKRFVGFLSKGNDHVEYDTMNQGESAKVTKAVLKVANGSLPAISAAGTKKGLRGTKSLVT